MVDRQTAQQQSVQMKVSLNVDMIVIFSFMARIPKTLGYHEYYCIPYIFLNASSTGFIVVPRG